jgi:hypothetical protein
MTFNEQKREAIATAKHLVEILGEVHDESPSTNINDRRAIYTIRLALSAARFHVLSILDRQDNPE